MRGIYTTLLVAVFILLYPGTPQAQKVKGDATVQFNAGGNLIGGIGNVDCMSQLSFTQVFFSREPLDVCFTATNTGEQNFTMELFQSSATPASSRRVPPNNTRTICLPAVDAAGIRSTDASCKGFWHVDQYDSGKLQ